MGKVLTKIETGVSYVAKNGLIRFWAWLKLVPNNIITMYYAWKHPHTPVYIKGLLGMLTVYILSPVDILPDYLPLLGFVDDATLISAAILYVMRLLPDSVRIDCRQKSERWRDRMPFFLGAGIVVLAAWIILLIIGAGYIFSKVNGW